MMLEHNGWLWLQVVALAFFGSLAVTGFMKFAGLGDASDGRSAHSGIVPTSGGVGIIAGLGLALCATGFIFPGLDFGQGFAPVIALIFAMGLLGLTDDRLTLGPKLKFGVMIIICGAAVRSIGAPETLPGFQGVIEIPYWVGFVGAVLWLFVVTNIVNFMDGANGMMGLSLSVAFFALFGIGLIAKSPVVMLLTALFIMTLLGFLPYNARRKAQIFGGDVGALTIGFGFAICVLFLVSGSPDQNFHLVGPVLILPFLIDTILTILHRISKKENILKAHNQHLYQRLIRGGRGHLTVSLFYAVLALICANIVVIGTGKGWFDTPQLFLVMLGSLATGWFLIGRSLGNPSNNKSG